MLFLEESLVMSGSGACAASDTLHHLHQVGMPDVECQFILPYNCKTFTAAEQAKFKTAVAAVSSAACGIMVSTEDVRISVSKTAEVSGPRYDLLFRTSAVSSKSPSQSLERPRPVSAQLNRHPMTSAWSHRSHLSSTADSGSLSLGQLQPSPSHRLRPQSAGLSRSLTNGREGTTSCCRKADNITVTLSVRVPDQKRGDLLLQSAALTPEGMAEEMAKRGLLPITAVSKRAAYSSNQHTLLPMRVFQLLAFPEDNPTSKTQSTDQNGSLNRFSGFSARNVIKRMEESREHSVHEWGCKALYPFVVGKSVSSFVRGTSRRRRLRGELLGKSRTPIHKDAVKAILSSIQKHSEHQGVMREAYLAISQIDFSDPDILDFQEELSTAMSCAVKFLLNPVEPAAEHIAGDAMQVVKELVWHDILATDIKLDDIVHTLLTSLHAESKTHRVLQLLNVLLGSRGSRFCDSLCKRLAFTECQPLIENAARWHPELALPFLKRCEKMFDSVRAARSHLGHRATERLQSATLPPFVPAFPTPADEGYKAIGEAISNSKSPGHHEEQQVGTCKASWWSTKRSEWTCESETAVHQEGQQVDEQYTLVRDSLQWCDSLQRISEEEKSKHVGKVLEANRQCGLDSSYAEYGNKHDFDEGLDKFNGRPIFGRSHSFLEALEKQMEREVRVSNSLTLYVCMNVTF